MTLSRDGVAQHNRSYIASKSAHELLPQLVKYTSLLNILKYSLGIVLRYTVWIHMSIGDGGEGGLL